MFCNLADAIESETQAQLVGYAVDAELLYSKQCAIDTGEELLGTPLKLSDEVISSVAAKIATARRLHGADSTYVIGLFAGLDWLFEGADADGVRRQLHDRVLELEGAPEPAAALPDAVVADPKSGPAIDGGIVENAWVKGAVKWFNNDKGYGFISTESDTDVFVHWRDISSWDRSLGQGDEVEFMVTKTAKGYQAVNVMKSDKPPAGESADRTDVADSEASVEESAVASSTEIDAESSESAAETPQSAEPAESSEAWNDGDSDSAEGVPDKGEIRGAMESAAVEGSGADRETAATSEPEGQAEEAVPSNHTTDAAESHTDDQDSAQAV